MLFLVLLGAFAQSQTVSLAPAVITSPGEDVMVPMNVTGFTGIGAITFYVRFNPDIITYIGTYNLANPAPGGMWLKDLINDSTISLVFTANSSFVTFPNGKLLDLKFNYKGMTASPLNFVGDCEVTQGLTLIFPTYTNGSVDMNKGLAQKATLANATAATGGNVTIPLEYTALPNVGSLTQKIHFDPTKLSFVNLIGIGDLASGTNYNVDNSAGIITISWFTVALGGKNINYNVAPFSKFLLNFVYIGNTDAYIDFVGGSLITTPVPATNIALSYFGDTVSLAATTANAVLGSVATAVQGNDFEVPLNLSGFDVGTTQAFTLTIPFDSPRLTFLGVKAPAPSGLVVSQATGTVTLAWSNASGPDINGTFLTLKFKYNGIGTAHVNFGNSCVFNTYNAGIVGTVQVAYTSSTITPTLAPANATIGFVPDTPGLPVEVPVSFSGLPLTMGAADVVISYDESKLTFVDAIDTKSGTNVQSDPANHKVSIIWTNPAGADINGEFLKLRFNYISGTCGATVSFIDGCQLTEFVPPATPIVPANWIDGGIDLKYKISGTLTYDAPSSVPLPGATIQIKSGPEPVPPAIAPVPEVLYTTTTDAAGHYEIYVPNGTYYIYATDTAAWKGVDLSDVTNIRRYIALLTSTLNSPLRLRSADVSMDGIANIDLTDVTAVRRRIALLTPNPSFKAADWTYENPMVVVDCAEAPDKNFTGLCSGDVTGSYPN